MTMARDASTMSASLHRRSARRLRRRYRPEAYLSSERQRDGDGRLICRGVDRVSAQTLPGAGRRRRSRAQATIIVLATRRRRSLIVRSASRFRGSDLESRIALSPDLQRRSIRRSSATTSLSRHIKRSYFRRNQVHGEHV